MFSLYVFMYSLRVYGFHIVFDSVYCSIFGVGVKVYCVVVVFYVSSFLCHCDVGCR